MRACARRQGDRGSDDRLKDKTRPSLRVVRRASHRPEWVRDARRRRVRGVRTRLASRVNEIARIRVFTPPRRPEPPGRFRFAEQSAAVNRPLDDPCRVLAARAGAEWIPRARPAQQRRKRPDRREVAQRESTGTLSRGLRVRFPSSRPPRSGDKRSTRLLTERRPRGCPI